MATTTVSQPSRVIQSRPLSDQYCDQFDSGKEIAAAIGLSTVISGAVAALTSYSSALVLPGAIMGGMACVIDLLVGPLFRMMGDALGLNKNRIEVQFLKTVAVLALVYVGVLPLVSAMFGIAIRTNFLATLVLTLAGNYLTNQVDKNSSIYWVVLLITGIFRWGPMSIGPWGWPVV
jgi:hypothetical protein